MDILNVKYATLDCVVTYSTQVSTAIDGYANRLTSEVANAFSTVEGGLNDTLTSAAGYVQAAVKKLEEKEGHFSSFSTNVSTFASLAVQVDQEVVTLLSDRQEAFFAENEYLRPDDPSILAAWWDSCVDSSSVLKFFDNLLGNVGTALSNMKECISNWYQFDGGKEIFKVVGAAIALAAAVVIAIVSFPASGVIAIMAAVASVITVVNATVNLVTETMSMVAKFTGEYAKSAVLSGRDSLNDVLSNLNTGFNWANKALSGLGATVDVVDAVCGIATGFSSLKNLAAKAGNITSMQKFVADTVQNMKDWPGSGKTISEYRKFVKTCKDVEKVREYQDGIKATVGMAKTFATIQLSRVTWAMGDTDAPWDILSTVTDEVLGLSSVTGYAKDSLDFSEDLVNFSWDIGSGIADAIS